LWNELELIVRLERITGDEKGWLAGPWDGNLDVSIGFANGGVDEPHVHSAITEAYLVARGSASIRVERETVELHRGDVLIIEAGERTPSSPPATITFTSVSIRRASPATKLAERSSSFHAHALASS
jgi:hypothetical protein